MRARLRPALHYAPVHDGVYFGTETGSFVIRGPEALFQVVDVCVPLLEAGATVDSVITTLGGEPARPVVTRLIETFNRHGLLIDLDRISVPEPAPEIREAYRAVLAELETRHHDPYAVFARLRAATVLVCGPVDAVLPTARGLGRAGVGSLILAVPEPAAAAAAAERLGAVVHRIGSGEPVPAAPAQAAVFCAEQPDLAALVEQQLPLVSNTSLTVRVALGEHRHLVGITDARTWAALEERTDGWVAAGSPPALGRPAADALAGALAGHLSFQALAETGTETVYVVHGASPIAEPVTLPGKTDTTPARAQDAVALAEQVTARWTGRAETVTPADLPQLPLALAEAEHRAVAPGPAGCYGPTDADESAGSAVAWGHDQESATVSALLAALRAQCPTPSRDTTGAAGLTEERWLLDGALRLLAGRAEQHDHSPALAFDTQERPARALWRTLEDYELVQVSVDLIAVPDIPWPLARVRATGTDELLSTAWGREPAQAVHAALATALARIQTRRLRGSGPDPVDAGSDTTLLATTSDAEAGALLARLGHCFSIRGERETDVLLPASAPWFGPVSLHPRTTAANGRGGDADAQR